MNRLYRTSINNKYQSHSNRGMVLENDLNATNEYYLLNNVAVIYKKPTPITINKVDKINFIIFPYFTLISLFIKAIINKRIA